MRLQLYGRLAAAAFLTTGVLIMSGCAGTSDGKTIALAEQGSVALAPYPAVQAWMARMQKLPGYVPMPGQFAAA